MDKKKKRKRGKVKKAKDEEVNGQGRRKGGKGVPRPHSGSNFAQIAYKYKYFNSVAFHNQTGVHMR